MIVRILVLTGLWIAGLWAGTQWAASQLGYDAYLSGRVWSGDGWAVYAPWSLLAWSFQDAGNLPPVKNALDSVLAYSVLLAVASALRMRHAMPRVKPFGLKAWGTQRDMKRAGLLNFHGTVVGLHRRRLLTYDGPEHQLVAGASRSGKGVGHVIPTLLCWPDSALVYDVKGELWDATAGFRAKQGQHCLLFNPTRLDSACFNPLLEVRKGPREIRDVQNIVEMLVNPDGSKKTLDVWDQNASQFLTALILHVLYTEPAEQKHLGRVRELLLAFNNTCKAMRHTGHRFDAHGVPQIHPEIARVAGSLLSQADRFRSSVRGTAEAYLTLWADPIVCQTTRRSDFSVGDLVCLDRPVTLYVQPPPSDADRVRPLIRLMLNQICRALMEHPRTDSRGRKKNSRLLLLLDEFPTLGRLEFFNLNLRQMASYGLKAHLIVQSFNDIAEQYGALNSILDNCHVVVCFASVDNVTCQKISAMTGDVTEYRESYSRPRSLLSGQCQSISQSEQVRPLLTPGEVRTLAADQQLVFVSGYRPMRTEKLRYYAYPSLAERVSPPPKALTAKLHGPDGKEGWATERAKGAPVVGDLADAGGDGQEEDGPEISPPLWGRTFKENEIEAEAGDYY